MGQRRACWDLRSPGNLHVGDPVGRHEPDAGCQDTGDRSQLGLLRVGFVCAADPARTGCRESARVGRHHAGRRRLAAGQGVGQRHLLAAIRNGGAARHQRLAGGGELQPDLNVVHQAVAHVDYCQRVIQRFAEVDSGIRAAAYIDLRQRLMARKDSPKIIDADPLANKKQAEVIYAPANNAIPDGAHAVGIELDDKIIWPDSVTCRLNIIDQQSHEDAVQLVKSLNGSLLIGVAAYRLPDRGVQRIVMDLLAATKCNSWLVLLNKNPAVSVAGSREQAWFRLAQACKIPAEQVITQ